LPQILYKIKLFRERAQEILEINRQLSRISRIVTVITRYL
jgi:hypothetical protein